VKTRSGKKEFESGPLSHSQGLGPPLRQNLDELLVVVVAVRPHVRGYSLLVEPPAALDVLAQAKVEVAPLAPLPDRSLVVELDLGGEEPCE